MKVIEWLQRKYINIQLWFTFTIEHAIKEAQKDGIRTTQAYMNMIQTDHIAPAVQTDNIPIVDEIVTKEPEWPHDIVGRVQFDFDSCQYTSNKVHMRDSLYRALKGIDALYYVRKSTRGQKVPILEFGYKCTKVTLRPNDNLTLGIELKSYSSPKIQEWVKRAMIASMLVPSERACYTTTLNAKPIQVCELETLIKNLIESYATYIEKSNK